MWGFSGIDAGQAWLVQCRFFPFGAFYYPTIPALCTDRKSIV